MLKRLLIAALGAISLFFCTVPCLAATTSLAARYDAVRGAMRTVNGKYLPLTGVAARVVNAHPSRAFSRVQPAHAVSGIVGPFPANEPAIASDPANSSHLIASANDYRLGFDSDAGRYASVNAGTSWSNGIVQYLISGPMYFNADGDPAVGIDTFGNDYYGSLGFDRSAPSPGAFPRSSIMVARSHPNNFDAFVDAIPVQVNTSIFNFLNDKDSIAVDNGATSSFTGSVYSAWTIFSSTNSPIFEAFSRDRGLTFSSPVQVSNPGGKTLCPGGATPGSCADNQGSSIAITKGGVVWVAFENADTPTLSNQILIAHSANGGASFGAPVKVADDVDISNPFGTFRVNSFPNLAANNGTAQLYIVWDDMRAGFSQILISTSTNGATWSKPAVVESDEGSNFHFFPAVSVQQSTGNVYVSWYDNSRHPGTGSFDYFYRKFKPNLTPLVVQTIVSSGTAITPCVTGLEFGCFFFGDYTSIATNRNGGYPIWTDTLTGQQEIEAKLVP